jgi:DNA polymerase-3 subunit beta
VPVDKLTPIVRESRAANLTLEADDEALNLRAEGAQFKILGYPVKEFPEAPSFNGEPDFEIPAGELNTLVNQTSFATAKENTRFAINGVLMDREGGKLAVVATDGRRLALARGSCQAPHEDAHHAIIPTPSLNLLQKLLQHDPEDSVRVKVADNQILFSIDSQRQRSLLSSNLVEGNFPPYHDVVPRDGDKHATIRTDSLISAVRQAALMTNEESKGVKFAFASDGLTLSSRAPEAGEAKISMDLSKYEGSPIEIGFNPQFVLDALKVIQAEEVSLEFKEPSKPGVIRTGPNYLYVVMPVNLS